MATRLSSPLKPTELGSRCGKPFSIIRRGKAIASLGFLICALAQPLGGRASHAGSLSDTIAVLRQEGRIFVPPLFYRATCDAQGCRVDGGERVPAIGSIVRKDAGQPGGYEIRCLAAGEEYPLQTPQHAAVPVVSLAYSKADLTRLFGVESDGDKSAALVASLVGEATLEGLDPYTEMAFSGKDMRRAASSLPADCRMRVMQTRPAGGMIVERVFARLVLKATLKEGLEFQDLKSKLLELQKLLQAHYRARIGVSERSGEKRLEISTLDHRLVSFRVTPLDDLKVHHKDWFE